MTLQNLTDTYSIVARLEAAQQYHVPFVEVMEIMEEEAKCWDTLLGTEPLANHPRPGREDIA